MRFVRRLDALNRIVLPKLGVRELGWDMETPIQVEIRQGAMYLTAAPKENTGSCGEKTAE